MPYDIGKLKYWRGKHLSSGHRLKIKLADKRNKKQRIKAMKRLIREGKWKAPWKGKKLPDYMKKKISETKKKQYSTEFMRRKTSRFFKRYWEEHPKKHAMVLNKTIYLWKKNPKLRAEISKKLSIAGKLRFKKNEERRKLSKTVTQFWQAHPELREKWRKRFFDYYAKNPEAKKKLLENQQNPFRRIIKTKSGYMVRTKGEQAIANKLSEAKINFWYEAEPILLEEQICIPDFWLSDFKIFIEYYGGYPKAWKKKVIKNKLYAKYSIPCIFITPAELLDLDYYLIREIEKLRTKYICKNFVLKRFQEKMRLLS
ncbi:hypothetical protein HZA33_00540 [Candidatus Pacearchaeota archaeon]|nr:hypothetical protein [Candidatus Pacearchaeota archaeon]